MHDVSVECREDGSPEGAWTRSYMLRAGESGLCFLADRKTMSDSVLASQCYPSIRWPHLDSARCSLSLEVVTRDPINLAFIYVYLELLQWRDDGKEPLHTLPITMFTTLYAFHDVR